MGDISSWATGIGLLIAAVFFMRMLREIYSNGTLDSSAFLVFRSASLLPLFVMVGVLVLCGIAAWLFPAIVSVMLWVMGAVALGAWIWMAERGIRAIRAAEPDGPAFE